MNVAKNSGVYPFNFILHSLKVFRLSLFCTGNWISKALCCVIFDLLTYKAPLTVQPKQTGSQCEETLEKRSLSGNGQKQ